MTLIVAAMKEEIANIKDHDVLLTGIGKVNAASKLTEAIIKHDIKAIYNVGFAGASHHYHVGDVIVVKKAMYHDVDVTLFGYEKGQIPHFPASFASDKDLFNQATKSLIKAKIGDLYTGDYFMTEAVDIPYVVDMEGAALYHVAYMYDIPIVSIKVISDIVGMDDHYENYKAFEKDKGAKDIAKVIDLLVKE